MNGHGKSDTPILPAKPSNKAAQAAEMVEGSGVTKGNSLEQNAHRTLGRARAQRALRRVRETARRDRKKRLTCLYHHVYNVDCLREAFYAMKRDAAPGVDGETWEHYEQNLETNLQSLSVRLRTGGYHAKPVRRVFIPKADGSQRPLGVTTLEDKLVQRSTVAVLNTIYETDFAGFSYGFRPGRSQHQALEALRAGLNTKVSWVLDADIRGYFDAIDHRWLVRFIEHRIADRRIVRLIQKWLRAGVLEDGAWRQANEGVPQGGSVSPLLANIYLHYVLDLWVHWWRRQPGRGTVVVVRFADDFVAGFQTRWEAEAFKDALKARFEKFHLELHPSKTRLLEFGRFAARDRKRRGEGKPQTFSFLGFTHICGLTQTGKFTVWRHTDRKRMRRKLQEVKAELRRRLHHSVPAVGAWLASVLRGHYNYYGLIHNTKALGAFRYYVGHLWYRTLRRRSQKARLNWDRMGRLIRKWLPPARAVHSTYASSGATQLLLPHVTT